MKSRKYGYTLTGLFLCGAIIAVLAANNWNVYGLEKFFMNPDKVPGKEIVQTESGIEVIVKNDQIVNSNSEVIASTDGKLAVILDKDKGLLIVNHQGSVVDDLADLKEGMTKYIVDKPRDTMRNIGNRLMAGQIVGDKLYYLSTYESAKAYSSLWIMDLKTRVFEQLVDSEKYGHLAYISATDEKIVLANDSINATVLEYYHDHRIVEHTIYGIQISNSPDSSLLAYRPRLTDSLIERNIRFYEYETKSHHKLALDEDMFYNHGGVWNDSGSRFAFIVYHHSNLEQFSLGVYSIESKDLIIIPPPQGKSFRSADYKMMFINDQVIEVPLSDGETVHITMN